MLKNKKTLSVCLLIFILAFTSLSLFPSLRNGFTNWDDQRYLTQNDDLRDFSLSGLTRIFSSFYNGNYHPLTMFSYFLEYHFFGSNPLGYHITNLLLHLLNCVLVFWLISLLSRSTIVPFVATLLFAIHPLNVEPVAWVSGRKDLFYVLFFLGSVIAYTCYLKNNKRVYYYFSICAFILSLFSKATAVMLPFILLLIDYRNKRKFDRNIFIEKAPFFELSFVFMLICIFTQTTFGAVINTHSLNFLYRGTIVAYALVSYIAKLLFPVKLSCQYPYPRPEEILGFRYLVSPAILFFLTALVIFLKRYTRKIIFGMGFFLVLVLPVIQILPFGNSITADRFTYLASVGIFYLIGEGAYWLYLRKNTLIKISVFLIFTGLILRLSFLSWQRSKVWYDSITLWSDVLSKYPKSLTAYNNRAIAYTLEEGDYEKAIEDCSRAIELAPGDSVLYFNRASAYRQKGDYDKANLDFRQYLKRSGFWDKD